MSHHNSTMRINFTEPSLSFLCDSLHEKKAFTIGDSLLSRSQCVQVISLLLHSQLMFFAEHKWVYFVFQFCMKKSSVGLDLFET